MRKSLVLPVIQNWAKWGAHKTRTVYYGCLPTFLIRIVHDSFYREMGLGENRIRMTEVVGCSVQGVYVTGHPEVALNSLNILASEGPAGRAGYCGSEFISEDGPSH